MAVNEDIELVIEVTEERMEKTLEDLYNAMN